MAFAGRQVLKEKRGAIGGDALKKLVRETLRLPERAGVPEYRWPLSSFVPGVLEKFDLPDCYRALAAKQLRQIEPWGALAANG